MNLRKLLAYLCIVTQSQLALAAGPTIWGPDSRALNLSAQGYTLQSGVTVDNDGVNNFIKASTAEASSQPALWSTYADAAQATPVNCTGGSPNVTWTRNTTTPLRGAADFKFTKDGSNRQGEGVAYAFTTGPSDGAGELLTINMPVKATEDAAYASGDLAVYVYDVTNTTLLTPTIVNVEDSAYQFTAQFNLSSSSSYRLCIHVASANTSAYDVYFDDITVGLQKYDWPGQINLSNSPIDATGWSASGSGVTVATSTTSTDLPLSSPYASSAIKITPVSGTSDYARTRVTVPAALASTMLKAEWYQRPLSGYASGDLKVDVYSNSASDCSGSFTRLSLTTDSSSVTSIPNATGKYTTYFTTDGSSVCYEVRFTRVAGTTALNITNFIFGPGIQPQGAVIGPWLSYTPYNNWTNQTTTGKYRQVGTQIEAQVFVSVTGTPAGGAIELGLPSGLTIDTSALVSTGGDWAVLGNGTLRDEGTNTFFASVRYASTSTVNLTAPDDASGGVSMGPYVAHNAPFTFANTDKIFVTFTAPISQWAGSSTVNLAQNTPEYVYNSSTSTSANDTSSFAYGPAGALIQNISATIYRDVTLQYPMQVGDILDVQVSSDRTVWQSVGSRVVNSSGYTVPQFGYTYNGATYRGIGILPQSSTLMRVYFGEYQTTYSSTNISWATGGGGALYWRVLHAPAGSAVGFGAADGTNSGLLPPVTSMGDALATQLGYKQYFHGTAYNGGVAPTITLSAGGGSLSSIPRGLFIPYMVQDGSWRMRFSIVALVSSTSRTSLTLAVNGVTFKNTSNWSQPIIGQNYDGAVGSYYSNVVVNTGTMTNVHATATTTAYGFSGDVELNAKPTWAY